jgi:hypothetical protein
MKHTILTLAIVTLVTAPLATPVAKGDKHKNNWGSTESEVINQTYEVGTNARLSLSNLNGAATITGWDKKTIEVVATKRGSSRTMLDVATVEFDLKDDHLRIEVEYDFDEDDYDDDWKRRQMVEVDFEIHVPRGLEVRRVELVNGGIDISDITGDVNVASVNGDVTGENLAGEAHLSTVNGDVKLSGVKADNDIELSSVNGSVTLYLPKNVNAKLSASTVHGDIDGDLGNGVTHAGSSMDAVLGSGGPRIELGTVNGDIKIRRAGSAQRGGADDDSD